HAVVVLGMIEIMRRLVAREFYDRDGGGTPSAFQRLDALAADDEPAAARSHDRSRHSPVFLPGVLIRDLDLEDQIAAHVSALIGRLADHARSSFRGAGFFGPRTRNP